MFICTGITPSVAVDTVKQSSMPVSYGNTLYVGGTGEGNYTKIQDAIDNATWHDTIFVFDDSSPYYENIIIDNLWYINLIGENKSSTIIDGEGKSNVIVLWSNHVEISNFTIINSYSCGIYIHYGYGDFSSISNNIILNSGTAIDTGGTYESLNISHNILENGKYGIYLDSGSNGTFTYNIIKKFKYGIKIASDIGPNNNIMCNQFEENKCGLLIWLESDFGKVIQNNFINNKRDILFYIDRPIRRHCLHLLLTPLFTDNYYDAWLGKGPKLIIGRAIIFYIPLSIEFLYIVVLIPILIIPWIMFDKHPAKEPYNIRV